VPPLAGEGGFDRTVKHHGGVDLACETGSSRDDAVSGSVSHLTECERGCEARDHTTSDDPLPSDTARGAVVPSEAGRGTTAARNDAHPSGLRTDINCPCTGEVSETPWYELSVKNIARVAVSTFIISTGLGFAGLGAATVAQAQPGPFPQWCPGDFWDPGWGGNPDGFHCHDGGPGFRQGPGGPGGWNHDDGRGWR